MIKILKTYKSDDYVYDISLDGSVVNALGLNIVSNTDGFNFKMPSQFRYTELNPYIGRGLNRDVIKGKAYTGLIADVMEFDDEYMRGKMGLGVDEVVNSSINFSRKNYADLLDDGSVKLVGNTVKSRRMSGFIAKFLENAIPMLLNGEGQKFLDYYFDYASKIYNYQIPLKDIATKGKIKKTLKEYIADCNTLTKSGSKKSRQVWYELALQNKMKVNIDDTLYYVNCGTKKSESDVKRVTHQFTILDGERVEMTAPVKRKILERVCEEKGLVLKGMKDKEKKELLKPFIHDEEDEIIINCKLIPNEIIEAEEDVMCNGDIEYNVIKYMEQFNSRIKPLLVCFHPDIRNSILITNPEDRQYFTEQQCELVSGFPNKEIDQDTYEALMTPERKEIDYWTSIGQVPPFVEECGIDWPKLVKEYEEIKAKEKDEMFQTLNNQYLDILQKLTSTDIEKFDDEYELPSKIDELMVLNSTDMCLYFKDMPDMKPTTGGYLFEDIKLPEALDKSVDDNGSDE